MAKRSIRGIDKQQLRYRLLVAIFLTLAIGLACQGDLGATIGCASIALNFHIWRRHTKDAYYQEMRKTEGLWYVFHLINELDTDIEHLFDIANRRYYF